MGIRVLVSASCLLFSVAPSVAQMPNLDYICGRTAAMLQQGGPQINASFSPQLASVVSMQTGNTGAYQVLIMLGRVMSTAQGNIVPLPYGVSYSCRTFHQYGFADWQLVFSTVTGRMWYASFQPFSNTLGSGQVPGNQGGPQIESGTASTDPIDQPVSQGEACRKFPDLCS